MCSPILRGRIDLIVDGGATPVGVESTIVACLGEPVLLRPGGVPREAIERVLGRPLADLPAGIAADDEAPLAPGMLASHYAPRTPLRLDAERVEPGEALLAFGPALPDGAERRGARPQPLRARRSDRGGGQSVFASARARRRRRESHRGDADPARKASAKRSTTGWRAPQRPR